MVYDVVPPDPAGTIESLGALGYTLEAAIADLVDNSIDAGAGKVDISFFWDGPASHITVVDNGHGMTEAELQVAMAIAARGPRTSTRRPVGALRYGTQDRELFAGVAPVGLDTVGPERAAECSGVGPRARRRYW